MASIFQLFLTLISILSTAIAQTQGETIWGSVVFTVPGNAPLIKNPPILSSQGAQQAMLAGSTIRRRYIDGEANNITSVHRIARLAKNDTKDVLDHSLLDVLSIDEQMVVGTALSFMQGLYPPLVGSRGNKDMIQWPSISAVTKDDYKYNWLAGANECSNHNVKRASYTFTKPYNDTQYATYDYYQSIAPYFPSLPSAYLTYTNAPTIASIAEYLHANNATFASQFSSADVAYLRSLASQHIWDNYGRYSQGNGIPVIGGRMLAGKILSHLTDHITSSTTGSSLSLLFGPAESLISFYSISGLAAKGIEFRQLPLPGSVLVLEVFSESPKDPLKSRLLIDPSKLSVRALIRNGTSASEGLVPVPLFYRGGSAGTKIPWQEFSKAMTQIAVQSPADWCTQCKSFSIFCAGFLAGSDTTKKVGGDKGCPQASLGKGCGKVSPTAAGFIGALVTTVLFIVAIAMLASCTGGKLAAWRKGRRDANAEAGMPASSSAGKAGWFGLLKHKRILKKERRVSDPDVADTTPDGKKEPRTDSWELRSQIPGRTQTPVGDEFVVVEEVVSPVSPLSAQGSPTGESALEERLRSTKNYAARDAELDREAEAGAAGVNIAVPREAV